MFWNGNNFVFQSDIKNIAECSSDVISPNYAKLVVKYNKSKWGSKPVKFFTKKSDSNHDWTIEESNGVYLLCVSLYNSNYDRIARKYINELNPYGIEVCTKVSIENDIIKTEKVFRKSFKNPSVNNNRLDYFERQSYFQNPIPWIEPTNQQLWAELESGSKFKISSHGAIGD